MLARAQGLHGLVDQTIRAQLPRDAKARKDFLEFVRFIRAGSGLLAPGRYRHRGGHNRLIAMVRALVRISLKSNYWNRPIEGWYCDVGNVASENVTAKNGTSNYMVASLDDQFHSLLRHLFAKYPVPRFLDKVWFGDSWSDCHTGVSVFLRIAQGVGPRQCGLPTWLTKAQARHFMIAPDDLTLMQAIRWAQVLAAGGSARLARTILRTRLSEQQNDESFWKQTVEWFCHVENCDQPTLSPEDVIEIVDFAQRHRFGPADQLLGYRANVNALQPEFSLRRKSLRWMRRHMVNWRTQLELPEPVSSEPIRQVPTWEPLEIDGLRWETERGIWTIQELLTGDELCVEGGIMRHCVGSYDRFCVRGRSSIWSVRLFENEVLKRVLTVELCPQRRLVVQAKGKRNSPPSKEAARVLRRWVRREGLRWSGRASLNE